MRPVAEIVRPGLFTTIQDLGRVGYQQYGVVVSGAMDPWALQVGNLLVGNERGAAALEMTMVGPELRWLEDVHFAIVGGDLSPSFNDRPLPLWKTTHARRGDVLRFGRCRSGARAYLCIQGGIEAPLVMNSRSTYTRAHMGGLDGRVLQAGDVLHVVAGGHEPRKGIASRFLHPDLVPAASAVVSIRVVSGPHEDRFTSEAFSRFYGSSYKVMSQSDRMGYRLEGPALTHTQGADILSTAVAPGTLQVPSSGQPILLLADRQTTGGYTQFATVISVDLPKLAQCLPGSVIRFEEVTLEEAQELYIEREKQLRRLQLAAGG